MNILTQEVIYLMHLFREAFTKVYLPIKSLLSRVSQQQVKLSLYLGLLDSFLQIILAAVFFTLSQNLLLLHR